MIHKRDRQTDRHTHTHTHTHRQTPHDDMAVLMHSIVRQKSLVRYFCGRLHKMLN